MKYTEVILFWFMVFSYVASFIFQLFGFIKKKENLKKYTSYSLYIAFLLHTAVGIFHWILSGHSPVTDTFELNLTGTWFTILIYLIFDKMGKIEKPVGLVVIPVTFLLLGYGYLHGINIKPIGPAYDSPWLAVHVIFAWIAFGCYAIGTGYAVFVVLKQKNPENERYKKMSNIEILDESSYRYIVIGFINHAIMIASGSLWAKKLWGNYWLWDPLETWSLISFLFYAFYLHARSFLNWKLRRASYLALLGIFIMIISYWGVGLFGPTPHPGP
ncbi:MAG: cytochrome c biogenesis protein CcsA [Spirochaetia bacterium]|nr:cytochrome c biogenesis protein CcsA [Spirochaetia bacterium]